MIDKFILVVLRLALSLIGIAVCLTPLWIYLFFRWFLGPQGFWQNLFLTGVGLYFLGGIQLFGLVGAISWLVFVWKVET